MGFIHLVIVVATAMAVMPGENFVAGKVVRDPYTHGMTLTPIILIPGKGGSQLEARHQESQEEEPVEMSQNEPNDESQEPSYKSHNEPNQRSQNEPNLKNQEPNHKSHKKPHNKSHKEPHTKSPAAEKKNKKSGWSPAKSWTDEGSSKRTCHRRTGWYRLWMDIWQIFPSEIECWADSMELQYHETGAGGYTTNAPGVEIRVPGWGGVDTIEYIDPSMTAWIIGAGHYMADFIHELERWGYKRNKNLRGAPYDFRYSPHSQYAYFRRLQHLVEDTYYINGRKKVALVAHSMGGLFGTFFLNLQTAAWKQQFIASFITLNTPWEGTAYMPKVMASGTNFGVPEINPLAMRRQQRSYETSPLLLPTLKAWGPERVLVRTPGRNYTAADYEEFFEVIGYPQGNKLLEKAQWDLGRLQHPGVDMYCLYSTGVKTLETVTYAAINSTKNSASKMHYDLHSDSGTDPNSVSGSDTYSKSNSHGDRKFNSYSKPKSNSNSNTNSDTEWDTYSNSNSKTDYGTNSKTDSDSNSNSNSNSNTFSNSNSKTDYGTKFKSHSNSDSEWDITSRSKTDSDTRSYSSRDTPNSSPAPNAPDFDRQPVRYEYGDGDGTVNRRSLVGCARFYDSPHAFHMRHLRRGLEHNAALHSRRFHKLVRHVLVTF